MSKKGQKCKVVKLLLKDKEMMVPAPQPMIFCPNLPIQIPKHVDSFNRFTKKHAEA